MLSSWPQDHASAQWTIAVLELCAGGSLQRHLQKLSRCGRDSTGHPVAMTDAEVALFGGQVSAALRHLHHCRCVHRDLKPANILFYGERHLKLCDFGFARMCNSSERLHTICGTPIYMAPELTRSASSIGRKGYEGFPVDVWAYGTLIYEMLHSRVAFPASDAEQLYRRIRAGQHAPMREDLPKEFRGLIKACLTIEPTRRPTAMELASCPILMTCSSPEQADQRC